MSRRYRYQKRVEEPKDYTAANNLAYGVLVFFAGTIFFYGLLGLFYWSLSKGYI